MKTLSQLIIIVCVGLNSLWFAPLSSAQIKAAPPQITFDSFTGIYHLSRDGRGLSLLTTEETILADFPGRGDFYGIKRILPKTYQNHAINIKIMNVSDAAGNEVPYKTTTDSNNNLVLTTGDPAINLYGRQTIKIRYQTSGVINLNKKNDEFLLNVNGRGWDQPFNTVNATLYVPASFGARLKTDPICYTVLNDFSASNCQISTKKSSRETVITSRVRPVAAHQALVVKLNFKSSTFTNNQALPTKKLFIFSGIIILLVSIPLYSYLRKRK